TVISGHRRACAPGSGSQVPSGRTGAVPATSTRPSTRTARLNPIAGSHGDPDEIRRRSLIGSSLPGRSCDADLDPAGGPFSWPVRAVEPLGDHAGEVPLAGQGQERRPVPHVMRGRLPVEAVEVEALEGPAAL